jgi:hypothetical protein
MAGIMDAVVTSILAVEGIMLIKEVWKEDNKSKCQQCT